MTQVLETIRNGVDTEQMYGTLDAIKAQPEIGGPPPPSTCCTRSPPA